MNIAFSVVLFLLLKYSLSDHLYENCILILGVCRLSQSNNGIYFIEFTSKIYLQQVQQAIDNVKASNHQLKMVLLKVKDYPNIPRKKNKFEVSMHICVVMLLPMCLQFLMHYNKKQIY